MKIELLKPLVDSLSAIDKLSLYMEFYCLNLAHRHEHGGNIPTFDWWCSSDRLEVRDNGDRYKERGEAQRIWIEPTGIYGHYNRFK